MPPTPLEPGDPARLGRFGLVARLGEGGQGVVYLGRGTGPGEERVAVKVLRSSADATVLQRLARELDAVHQVQPFLTARVIEASVEGDRRFIVSEFIDGPSLQERVRARGPLPEGDLLRLAVGTATALTAIHGAGVVHRDFKPANVLLGPDGPRVVDFGIARLTDAATITSGLIGTPSYVAPEQLAGARPTSAVDIFAWAVTIVYAATGRLAFGADSVPAVMHRIMYEEPDLSGVPPSLRPIVGECLDKDPGRRPSARDLLLRLVDPSAQQAAAAPAAPAPLADSIPLADSVPYTGPMAPLGRTTGSGRPGAEPTTLSRPGRAAPRPRRGLATGVWALRGLWAGAAAVAVLVVLGIVLLTRGSPPHPPASAGSSSAAAQVGNSASATTAATQTAAATGVTIPASFAGTWTGMATMSALAAPGISMTNSITFTFTAGARTAHEINQDCVNTLTLTGATATVLTFSEPQTPACVAGTVTFTRHGTDLAYHWTDHIEQNVATLHEG